ncbi:MAG TPA: M48 family metallopeptidase [Solirubrobacteraceae bacterium]|nr:M48 family metallopeptidase [Solirubrobacteraceae bacterium]
MTLPVPGYQLSRISPKAYEHPADRAATAALKAIPHLDSVVRKLIEYGYERAMRRGILGSAVRLGDDQLPSVWRAHARAYATLDIEPAPELYLTQYPFANAMTIGAGRPIVVLNSELVRLSSEQEMRVVCAHEAGHVLSDHVLYRTALVILMQLSFSVPGIPVPIFPLKMALMEWFRASELSCDRAAALVVRDPLAVCRTLMVLAAGAEATDLDLDAFVRQGQEYREKSSPFDRLSRLTVDLNLTHPMSVQRVHELMNWVRAGDYDRIVGGEYVTRDEPPNPRSDAADAVNHYAERLRSTLEGLGEPIDEAARRVSDWLRKSRDEGE